MGKHRDWTEIEKDYLESDLSYAQLAEKHGISISTLKKVAAKKGWAKKKSEIPDPKAERVEAALMKMEPHQMEPETEPTVIDRESDKRKFQRIVDGMLDRVEEAICMVSPNDAQSIKLLTSALKDLRDLKHLNKSELDIEEQRARIDKLRSETHIVESDDAGGVILMPEIQEVPQPDE